MTPTRFVISRSDMHQQILYWYENLDTPIDRLQCREFVGSQIPHHLPPLHVQHIGVAARISLPKLAEARFVQLHRCVARVVVAGGGGGGFYVG